MDTYIWQKVLKFVKRLHPNKSMKWIIKTYFPAYDDGKHKSNWVLTGSKEGNKLIKMAWTPIKKAFYDTI
jgi:RNA-directed DNA polymerase